MPNENDSNKPPSDPQDQPLRQPPMTPTAPQQDEMRVRSNSRTEDEESKTIEIEKDIRSGERWLIGISAAAVFLNAVIALIYYGQLKEMRKATTASEKAATAAASAADIADKTLKEIRTGGTDTHELAVQSGKQVTKLDASIREAHSLASAAHVANENAVEADRPWIGGSLTVQDFAVGKVPTYTVTFANVGKRPAKVSLTSTYARPYNKFPSEPEYHFDTIPSTSFIVPGQSSVSSWKSIGPILQPEMDALTNNVVVFYVYAKVEYADVRGNAKYWTHTCWQYFPKTTFLNNGFLNCPEYSDAK